MLVGGVLVAGGGGGGGGFRCEYIALNGGETLHGWR